MSIGTPATPSNPSMQTELPRRSLVEQMPMALDCIEQAVPLLPRQAQRALCDALRNGDSTYDEKFTSALQELRKVSPALDAIERQGLEHYRISGALVGPVLFWCLKQAWSSEVSPKKTETYLKAWRDHLGASTYRPCAPGALLMADLSRALLETRLCMSAAKKTKLRVQIYDTAHGMTDFPRWVNTGGSPSIAQLSIALGLLAEGCASETFGNQTVIKHWEESVTSMTLTSTSKSTLVEPSLKTPGQIELLAGLFNSPLSSTSKMRIARVLDGNVWNAESVAAGLDALLPANERARIALLPFDSSRKDHSRRINQQLVQTYCPQLYPLLELLADSDDWLNHRTMLSHVRRAHAPQASLSLPELEFAF